MSTTPVSESAFFTNLLNDHPIHEGASDSQVVFENDVMRHVLLNFDAGWVVTEHFAPRAAVAQVISGKLRFRANDTVREISGGDAVYLAPGTPHALEALEPTYMAVTLVDVENTAYAAKVSTEK